MRRRLLAVLGAGLLGLVLAGCFPPASDSGSGSGSAEPTATTAKPDPNVIAAGLWEVPEQVKPGTYQTDEPGCYWARLRDLDTSSVAAIAANGNTAGPTRVKIARTDKGFETDCVWRKVR